MRLGRAKLARGSSRLARGQKLDATSKRSSGRDILYRADIAVAISVRAVREEMNHVNPYRPQLDLRLKEVDITEEPQR